MTSSTGWASTAVLKCSRSTSASRASAELTAPATSAPADPVSRLPIHHRPVRLQGGPQPPGRHPHLVHRVGSSRRTRGRAGRSPTCAGGVRAEQVGRDRLLARDAPRIGSGNAIAERAGQLARAGRGRGAGREQQRVAASSSSAPRRPARPPTRASSRWHRRRSSVTSSSLTSARTSPSASSSRSRSGGCKRHHRHQLVVADRGTRTVRTTWRHLPAARPSGWRISAVRPPSRQLHVPAVVLPAGAPAQGHSSPRRDRKPRCRSRPPPAAARPAARHSSTPGAVQLRAGSRARRRRTCARSRPGSSPPCPILPRRRRPPRPHVLPVGVRLFGGRSSGQPCNRREP